MELELQTLNKNNNSSIRQLRIITMVRKLNFLDIGEYQIIFRIGIFLPYIDVDKPTWITLRDHLRTNEFPSAFLVEDYLNHPFGDEREKSFYFLRNCHTPFFIIEEDVGKGGVVAELEEYKREVYPRKGKIAVVFEKCKFVKDRILDSPSTVIAPNLTEDKFYVRRFLTRDQLPEMLLGMARNILYRMLKNPWRVLDIPEIRLACENCKEKESQYICQVPCEVNCGKHHLCSNCLSVCCQPHRLYTFSSSI